MERRIHTGADFNYSGFVVKSCPDSLPAANLSLARFRLLDGFAFIGMTDAYALSVCLVTGQRSNECMLASELMHACV